MISWLYSLVYSLAFFLMVLYISAYSIIYLVSPFSSISRRFVVRVRVGDDYKDLIAMISLMISSNSVACLSYL